ncbi:MAG: pseudouridine synthase [Lachnospiraceae bacterium]|nr:pseudouridine synthase [Lachnospiraceae bacterium]
MSDDQGIRINKYLAKAGICSRREADKLIGEGKVQINGVKAGVGDLVRETDRVTVGNREVHAGQKTLVYAFYKPVGVTCTEKDRFAARMVKDYIQIPERLTYAGRLDKDSEGLLLLTNDGDLIQTLMRGANRHEKEYVVKVNKEITPEFVSRMSAGIFLEQLGQTTRACTVDKVGKYTFRIILTQGLNRQIRRMCEACGYKTESLKRVRINNILLGSLVPGQMRQITGEELSGLYESIGRKTSNDDSRNNRHE